MPIPVVTNLVLNIPSQLMKLVDNATQQQVTEENTSLKGYKMIGQYSSNFRITAPSF
jgi:hypothetical protein